MKPSIGRTIYCIYQNGINEDNVGYLGKDSFIVDDFSDLRRFDSLEYFYDDYQRTWFTSLPQAKKALLSKLHREYPDSKFKLKHTCDDYWECEKTL